MMRIRGVASVLAYSLCLSTTAITAGFTISAKAQLPVTEGLTVWLKADAIVTNDTATQVRVDGSDIYVKKWNDQSGNGNNASNTTEADQPLYIAGGTGGLPSLRFTQDDDNYGDRLYLGDLSAQFPSAGTIFAVSAPDNDGRYNIFGNRGNDERWVANSWNESRPGSFRNARSTNASFTLSDWPQSGAHIYSLESGSSVFRVIIDGSEIGSDSGDYHNGNGANWTVGNRATNGQQLEGDISELILFNRILTTEEADQVGGYLAGKYGVTGTAYPTSIPDTPSNLAASVTTGPVDLSWDAADMAGSYTIKRSSTSNGPYSTIGTTTATSYSDITGAIGTTYYYVVAAINSWGSSADSDEIAAARSIGTSKEILTFDFGTLGTATISGTNIIKNVAVATDVTSLAPTYTVSLLASEDPQQPSGATIDFSNPVTYNITAEDGTTNAYLVSVIKTAPITYDFNDGLQGWEKIWPSSPSDALWENGALGSGYDGGETRFGRSPEFYINNLGDLTFELRGGESELSSPDVGPSEIPELAIDSAGFAGAALRDVESNTYVLSRRRTGNGGTPDWQPNLFSAGELAAFANNGRKYTLDYIDYNKGGWGWTYMDNVSIPGTFVTPVMTSFILSPYDPATISETNIVLRVAFGVDISSIAPLYTYSPAAPFASGSPVSGSTQDFSSGPVAYSLISADQAVTNTYMVTVEVMPDPADSLVGQWVSFSEDLQDKSGYTPPGTHDGSIVGNSSGLTYSPDTPPGFAGSSLYLPNANAGVKIDNTRTNDAAYAATFDEGISNQLTVAFWAKGFPEVWNPWVAKRGDAVSGVNQGWQIRRMNNYEYAGFTLRGVTEENGWGSSINVNDNEWHHFAGVWDQASGTRTLYIDGAVSHINYNDPSQTMVLAPSQALTIGARADGGNGYQSYFQGLIYDVRIYKQALFSNQVHTVMTTPMAAQSPEAKIKTFGISGSQANIDSVTGEVTWMVPIGTDRTALAPEFTLSPGASCNHTSGEILNFSKPVTYRVISSDSAVTNMYTINAQSGYTFNDGTLQGWHNRVWDTNANNQAGAWVDLEPGVTTMPSEINEGNIVPDEPDDNNWNGLFIPNNKAVRYSGNGDYHMNTLWLRSPEFYLDRSGDLTVELAGGTSKDVAAPSGEVDIDMAAAQNAGWMGIALRRVSDDSFVIVKPKTQGNSTTWYTFTITASELAALSSSEKYTLELINADKGSWGWLVMDNVIIPGDASQRIMPGTIIILR